MRAVIQLFAGNGAMSANDGGFGRNARCSGAALMDFVGVVLDRRVAVFFAMNAMGMLQAMAEGERWLADRGQSDAEEKHGP